MISSMMRGSAYESMMCPFSSTISENVMPTGSLSRMQALLFDVGGVLLIPHAEDVSGAVGRALPLNVAASPPFRGVHAMDRADAEPAPRRAYLEAYAGACGIHAADTA